MKHLYLVSKFKYWKPIIMKVFLLACDFALCLNSKKASSAESNFDTYREFPTRFKEKWQRIQCGAKCDFDYDWQWHERVDMADAEVCNECMHAAARQNSAPNNF